MKTQTISPETLERLRGKRTRESIAHEMRQRGHATDAKSVWRWERGLNQPHRRFHADLAEILGAESVDELYEDDEEEAALQPELQMMLEAAVADAVSAFREALQLKIREVA